MKKYLIYLYALVILAISACTKDIEAPDFPDVPLPAHFAKGADVSWVTQMEAEGILFRNDAGEEQDLFGILKDKGMNTIRLRVWVDPVNGWNNVEDLLVKAQRAKQAGYRLMIDFHYSDSWADPGQQTKPAAWRNLSAEQLADAVVEHTTSVLHALQAADIRPEWVQVGNETNDGMLWEEGRASADMAQFATFVQAGYEAVKSVDESCKVIVHLANGYDNALYRWIFDGLTANGAHWDVIGMSLYPTVTNWATLSRQCQENMNDMVGRYGSEVMLCEVGMPYTSPEACRAFLGDIIARTASVRDGKGMGVLYWEPQAYQNWQGYALGAFDDEGKPTVALDAFSITSY